MNDKLIYRISSKNINQIKFDKPQNFSQIMLDTNLTCNLHCLYCHNDRTTKLLDKNDLIKFIDEQIDSVDAFQFGCQMEPTMDRRLGELLKLVSKSKARPRNCFRLQTNGILLNKHNLDDFKEAGISLFTISLDTLDPEVHKELRGGSDIQKILTNIINLRKSWDDVEIKFVTTLNKLNINLLEDVIKYAVDNKIDGICIRNMFYFPNSSIIQDHEKMQAIVLDNEVFLNETNALKEKYKNYISFNINDEEFLKNRNLIVKV